MKKTSDINWWEFVVSICLTGFFVGLLLLSSCQPESSPEVKPKNALELSYTTDEPVNYYEMTPQHIDSFPISNVELETIMLFQQIEDSISFVFTALMSHTGNSQSAHQRIDLNKPNSIAVVIDNDLESLVTSELTTSQVVEINNGRRVELRPKLFLDPEVLLPLFGTSEEIQLEFRVEMDLSIDVKDKVEGEDPKSTSNSVNAFHSVILNIERKGPKAVIADAELKPKDPSKGDISDVFQLDLTADSFGADKFQRAVIYTRTNPVWTLLDTTFATPLDLVDFSHEFLAIPPLNQTYENYEVIFQLFDVAGRTVTKVINGPRINSIPNPRINLINPYTVAEGIRHAPPNTTIPDSVIQDIDNPYDVEFEITTIKESNYVVKYETEDVRSGLTPEETKHSMLFNFDEDFTQFRPFIKFSKRGLRFPSGFGDDAPDLSYRTLVIRVYTSLGYIEELRRDIVVID